MQLIQAKQNNNNIIINLYSKRKDSKVSVRFLCDKFWIRGSVGPNYGLVDDEKMSRVSLYSEIEKNEIVYYVSPSLEFQYQTIALSNVDINGINGHEIHYQQTPDDQTMRDNLDGLINVTCD